MFRNVIETSGNVKAAREQSLQAAGDGIVEYVYVREGQWVKKGQLLLKLDTVQQEYNLASHDFLMDQERINGSPKKLALMAKQRDVLLKNIEDRKIIARFDGVVAQLSKVPGDYVKAQDKLGVLVDRSFLRATVEIVETDAIRLRAGQKIQFSFPAYPGNTVQGHVVSYPAIGKITSRGVTVLETEIRIDNPPPEILPGYSFSAVIHISEDEQVLVVEREAIGVDQGRTYVERVRNGIAERIPVSVEDYGRQYVKILDGVQEGDVLNGLSPVGRYPAGDSSMSVSIGVIG